MTPPYIRKQLSLLAKARNGVFANMKRNRPLSKNYEEVGVMGEWEFAKFCGLMPKMTVGGDGGVDFELPVVFTVDVKTSRSADRLLVEAGKVKADIYVLAWYMDGEEEGEVTLIGWTSAAAVKANEPRDSGRGIINHVVEASALRPMDELRVMMGRVRR